MKKILFTLLLIGVFVFTGSAFAADNLIKTAKLTVGTETPPTVAAGSDVTLPVSVSGTDGKAGGVAFTLNYEKAKVTFKGLTKGTPALQDPTQSCGKVTDGCDPYNATDGIVKTDPALFYLANDDKNGKVMIAAASAVAVKDGVLFNAVFTVIAGVPDGTSEITVTETTLPVNTNNTNAGYEVITDIPVLVGMPAAAADPTTGFYAVTDYYHDKDKATDNSFVTLVDKGTITVTNVLAGTGDVVGVGGVGEGGNGVDLDDLFAVLDFYLGTSTPTANQLKACDFNIDGKIKDDLDDLFAALDEYLAAQQTK